VRHRCRCAHISDRHVRRFRALGIHIFVHISPLIRITTCSSSFAEIFFSPPFFTPHLDSSIGIFRNTHTMSLNRGSEAEKGDAEVIADKFENVDARDVTALTRRILWKMDTR
jgi:hypothetical protein